MGTYQTNIEVDGKRIILKQGAFDLHIFFFVLSIMGLLFCLLFYHTNYVKVVHRAIDTEIPNKIRFIHISDIHGKTHFINGSISGIINQEKPDFVIATGDYANNLDQLPGVLEELSLIQSPLYLILGNYEREEVGAIFRKIPIDEAVLVKNFEQYKNMNLLINDYKIFTKQQSKILIYGFDNSIYGNEYYNPKAEEVKCDYRLIIAHSPDIINTVAEQNILYHQILVGHTHGGQIKFLRRFNRKYAHFHTGMKQIISKQYFCIHPGLGTVKIPFRFNSFPELTVYKIK